MTKQGQVTTSCSISLTVHPWMTRNVLEVLLNPQAVRESGLPGTMKHWSSSGWDSLRRENEATVRLLSSSCWNKSFKGSRKSPDREGRETNETVFFLIFSKKSPAGELMFWLGGEWLDPIIPGPSRGPLSKWASTLLDQSSGVTGVHLVRLSSIETIGIGVVPSFVPASSANIICPSFSGPNKVSWLNSTGGCAGWSGGGVEDTGPKQTFTRLRLQEECSSLGAIL